MIIIKNHLGEVTLSNRFFIELIGGTVTNCFGVVNMNSIGPKHSIIELLPFIKRKRALGKGVNVKITGNKLYIDIHIMVMYGVNLSSIVKSIQHKVRYAVEEETDLSVEEVNVYIDGIKG